MHAVRVTPQQIDTFRRDGVVVLEGVFSPEEVAEARAGLAATLLRRGVDVMRLEETAGALRSLSSTHGSGGVLDCYYPHWKLKVRRFQVSVYLALHLSPAMTTIWISL
jgi:hypothetical protein